MEKNYSKYEIPKKVKRVSRAKKYRYFWIILILFSGSILDHWYYGFSTGQSFQENFRDTFENWQSEFLQLMWQVGGLAFLWHVVGSPQSKEEEEEEERNQEILQWIIKRVDLEKTEEFIKEMEKK